MEIWIADFEYQLKTDSIEINGISIQEKENPSDLLIKVADAVKVQLYPTDKADKALTNDPTYQPKYLQNFKISPMKPITKKLKLF